MAVVWRNCFGFGLDARRVDFMHNDYWNTFGVQCFKNWCACVMAFRQGSADWNFGVGGLLLNIIWIIFFGWELALSHFITGLLFCITIVEIPFGLQHFKLAKLGLVPFGARIN